MRNIFRWLSLIFLTIFSLQGSWLFASNTQKILGTTVSMEPPQGFTKASGFVGFQNQSTQASIVIIELPAEGYSEISQALFSDIDSARKQYAAQGVTITDLKSLETHAEKVPVIIGTQQGQGLTFNKWIALFKGTKTVMITIQAPEKTGLDEKEAFKILKSVELSKAPSAEEKLASLPFTFTPTNPFRVVDTMFGSTVQLTAGILNDDPEGKQSLMIIGTQISGEVPTDLKTTARLLLSKTTSRLEDAKIESEEKIKFAGGEGLLLTGKTSDGALFSQYLTLGKERYILLIAICPANVEEKEWAAIKTIAESVAFRKL